MPPPPPTIAPLAPPLRTRACVSHYTTNTQRQTKPPLTNGLPNKGLDGSIEQPLLAGGSGLGGSATPATGSFSRVFSASWMAKPALPLVLAPGEVQGFVLSISPAGEPLPPRRAGGRFESPVRFEPSVRKPKLPVIISTHKDVPTLLHMQHQQTRSIFVARCFCGCCMVPRVSVTSAYAKLEGIFFFSASV